MSNDEIDYSLLPGHALSPGEIYIEMKKRLDAGARAAAMATVVKTSGSTPQQVGAKMVVFEDGSVIGMVCGGQMYVLIERWSYDDDDEVGSK